jgi:N-formylglutamate deformylase
MFSTNHPDHESLFKYYYPQEKFIGVLSIPHSGEILPSEFEPYLISDRRKLMQDVDYRVHHLVDIPKLVESGIFVIVSNIIRVAVDLNRAPEISVLNWKRNSQGVEIVTQTPNKKEEERLITQYHTPYFEMLKGAINQLANTQKVASFIDLHSMPSRATDYHLKINPNQKIERPHFCLSDIEGQSCVQEFIDFACSQLKKFTPNITQNDPYFGGFITRHINDVIPNVNNIQIEINRGIYMNENKIELIDEKVNQLKPILTDAIIKTFQHFNP